MTGPLLIVVVSRLTTVSVLGLDFPELLQPIDKSVNNNTREDVCKGLLIAKSFLIWFFLVGKKNN
jgi:hypothetical protein